ncbi:uncharacterized protein C8Q71DRAFT_740109 [Rhodofomes roseus]|uniref:Uncharacterized protein n=1 Tax=Rhodofomes roseus TaxID=34475 RepID=A0ABQ8KPN5_9APHY|nr:uncharacterized protein C8Q71DRAFT_740109 [Rhodofomes roseus]KAH9840578.1 hypothetical protein C8Q71DRAFT_740109 [Rhodofomes roseus]
MTASMSFGTSFARRSRSSSLQNSFGSTIHVELDLGEPASGENGWPYIVRVQELYGVDYGLAGTHLRSLRLLRSNDMCARRSPLLTGMRVARLCATSSVLVLALPLAGPHRRPWPEGLLLPVIFLCARLHLRVLHDRAGHHGAACSREGHRSSGVALPDEGVLA